MMIKKRRIAVVGPTGYPGGLQTHHSELKAFLRGEGHDVISVDVDLISVANANNVDDALQYRVRNFPGFLGKVVRAFDWSLAIYKINRFKPYICIAVANGYGYGLMAKFLPREIFTVCTEVTCDFSNGDSLRVFMASSFSATIVQSPGLLSAQREKISKTHPLAVLPCFAQSVPSGFLASKPAVNERIRLVFCGRLARNKGLCELLQVLSYLPPSDRPVLDIWGKGNLSFELQEMIVELKLDESVALKGGYPSDSDYAQLLASYHGLVLPSQFCEGLPLVLLEASSVGLPFFSTNIGAIYDCAIDNPDVRVIQPGISALEAGIKDWLVELANGLIEPMRLRNWFTKNHSRIVQEEKWRQMLSEPAIYFKKL